MRRRSSGSGVVIVVVLRWREFLFMGGRCDYKKINIFTLTKVGYRRTVHYPPITARVK